MHHQNTKQAFKNTRTDAVLMADVCTPISVLFTAFTAVDSGTYCDVVMLCVAPVTFAYAADPTPHIAVLSADCTVLVNVVCVLLLAYTCVLL